MQGSAVIGENLLLSPGESVIATEDLNCDNFADTARIFNIELSTILNILRGGQVSHTTKKIQLVFAVSNYIFGSA